jgi:hypothetical protein
MWEHITLGICNFNMRKSFGTLAFINKPAGNIQDLLVLIQTTGGEWD